MQGLLLLGVSLVRSLTSDSSTSRSSRSDRHMFAVIVGACWWMPTCLRRCMGIFAGLKNPWSSGCMYLATTRRVVVLKSCSALRIDCGGRCVSVGRGGGVRDPPRRVKRANISSHEAPGFPGSACFQYVSRRKRQTLAVAKWVGSWSPQSEISFG